MSVAHGIKQDAIPLSIKRQGRAIPVDGPQGYNGTGGTAPLILTISQVTPMPLGAPHSLCVHHGEDKFVSL